MDTSIPLEKELIYTESYLLCVNKNHPLAHADSVTIDEIRSLPFVAYSDQVYEKVFKRWERKINWENRQIVIELPSSFSLRHGPTRKSLQHPSLFTH